MYVIILVLPVCHFDLLKRGCGNSGGFGARGVIGFHQFGVWSFPLKILLDLSQV